MKRWANLKVMVFLPQYFLLHYFLELRPLMPFERLLPLEASLQVLEIHQEQLVVLNSLKINLKHLPEETSSYLASIMLLDK